MDTFGERLKIVRGDRSQATFAKELGIPQVTLSNYETNKTEPKFKLLKTIVSIFCINIEWLMIGTGPMRQSDVPKTEESHDSPPTNTFVTTPLCPRCSNLEAALEMEKTERRGVSDENRELSAENRRLLRENGDLRERCATLEGQLKCYSIQKNS